MAYAADEKIPEDLFVQLLTKKANTLRKHLKDTHSSLVMCANIGPNIATFKLYNTKGGRLLHSNNDGRHVYTITNSLRC